MNNKREVEMQYKKYVDEHIANVKLVWSKFRETFKYYGGENTREIDENIEDHDQSKYGDLEFDGYRQNFFPEKGVEKDKEAFNYAWNSHQKSNPHHWQFWVMYKPKGSVALKMPLNYIIEMLCDLTAMSIKFNDPSVSVWYNDNKENMLLHPDTARTIDINLPSFDKVLEDIRKGSTKE